MEKQTSAVSIDVAKPDIFIFLEMRSHAFMDEEKIGQNPYKLI